jgi:hypothetical protein
VLVRNRENCCGPVCLIGALGFILDTAISTKKRAVGAKGLGELTAVSVAPAIVNSTRDRQARTRPPIATEKAVLRWMQTHSTAMPSRRLLRR